MANVWAVKTGNWSDTTVWNTGALPTSADDVWSNTFTVTIDVSPTVLSIRNGATTGVTAGGSFVPTNGITLTATGAGVVAAAANCFVSSLTTGQSCTLEANCTGGAAWGANNNSTGTLNITGNCTAGSGSFSYGALNYSTGTLNITGNCTGGSGSSAEGARNNSTGTLNITGNCTGGSGHSAFGANNNSTGTLNITGNCTGGSGTSAFGAINNSTGTLTHVGTAQASTAAAAIGFGVVGQVTILTGPLISSDGSGGTAAASGVNPCIALRWFPADTALGTFEYRMRGATVSGSPSVRPARQLFLTDAYDATYPNASNVRSATTYGPGNIYTGTCAVPPAGSVALGVPVDNTTGTAAIDGASIRAAVGLASANLDSQLDALPTAAEVWSAATRTITGGTVDTLTNSPDVPTEAEIASQVRTELSTELGRIDATISSRLAPDGTLARVTLTDTATTLTNAPTVPTPEEIAAEVRSELTPELERVANCATVESTGAQLAALDG